MATGGEEEEWSSLCLDEHPDLGRSIVRWVQFSRAAAAAPAAADANKDDQIGKLPRRNEKKIATLAFGEVPFYNDVGGIAVGGVQEEAKASRSFI